ncbi:MAG: hypothetical protein DSY32_00100 [Aquifex sp.]|nr:MAG: hypothetical protein DSY32_00100 [Aquifex sp.]
MKIPQKTSFISNYLNRPSQLSPEELQVILEEYPYKDFSYEENINYKVIKLLRSVAISIKAEKLSEKLNISKQTAKEILTNQAVEVKFPVVIEGKGFINTLLLVPLSSNEVVSTEPVDKANLELLSELIGKGFFVTFEKNFNFKTNSYTLALYAGLVYGKEAGKFAFTGKVTTGGKLEEVENVTQKLELCRNSGIPLIFAKRRDMESVEDLEEFLTKLQIPIFIFPSKEKEREAFLTNFKFSQNYIKSVFHLEEELSYIKPFNETPEDFEEYIQWLKRIGEEIKTLKERYLPSITVGITSNPVVFSFIAGVIFSKNRLNTVFYKYLKEGKVYKSLFTIESDRDIPETEGARNLIKIFKNEGEMITVTFNNRVDTDGIVFKIPSGELLDKHSKALAYIVNEEIRSLEDKCYDLVLETSNDFAFALGYYLEDYKCLNLFHRGKFVYYLQNPSNKPYFILDKCPLYLLNTRMFHLHVKEVSPEIFSSSVKKYGYVNLVEDQDILKVLNERFQIWSEHKNWATLNRGDRVFLIRREKGRLRFFEILLT